MYFSHLGHDISKAVVWAKGRIEELVFIDRLLMTASYTPDFIWS